MKTLKIRTQSFLSIKQFYKDVLTSEELKISLPAQCFDTNHIPLDKLVDKLNKVLTVNQVDTVFIPNEAFCSRHFLQIFTLLTDLKVKIKFEKKLNETEIKKIPLTLLRRLEI
ncbi:hypothetical protein A2I96_17235 [Pseudoalteromonas tetraodonis]|uniref:DUF4325 domain-containing protein n=1 Tax=Pseudoalteromonas tetraodonis TaxID=43659 RepID=A0ABD4EKI5_9GAMM|nr:hypothetical protein [Pseudoalteromonas spiralis]KYL32760.1 hypothetical protein A2I96_17235 [Pseudoalteromonas spiralis]